MYEFINWIIREGLGQDPATWAGTQWVWAAWICLLGLLMVVLGAIISGICTWLERRIAGRMQSRVGPNRNGPAGFLQWIADAVKLLFKEDLVPAASDKTLFRIAPYFVIAGMTGVLVSLPFGPFIAADLNVGLFYILAVTSFVVVGVIMSGWASNSKWALFGAMRMAAQIVSYEIPAGLAIMVPVLAAGTLSMQGIIQAQDGAPWGWFVFHSPMAFVAFFIYFAASLAEGSRTPFDLPEAESEIVSGYNTEYSGFRFAMFFLEEFANVYIMSAITTVLFLGGWQVPFVPWQEVMAGSWLGWKGLAFVVFMVKAWALVFVVMWIRWTLPRVRVDQMMNVCWKYLVPAGLACVVLSAAWEPAVISFPRAHEAFTAVFFAVAGLLPFILFVRQTFLNLKLAGDKFDLKTNW